MADFRKWVILIAAVALFALVAHSQTLPADFIAAGVSYNQGASPAIAGTGIYAHKALDGTYSISGVDILPTSTNPLKTQTNTWTGVAQKVYTFGSVPIFAIAAGGSSTTGNNTGWAWTAGGGAPVPLGKGWVLMPCARYSKSSVADGRVIVGLLVGWGK